MVIGQCGHIGAPVPCSAAFLFASEQGYATTQSNKVRGHTATPKVCAHHVIWRTVLAFFWLWFVF